MSRPRPESGRWLRGSLQVFDLRGEAERLRGEKEWQGGGRNAVTPRKDEGSNEVLLMMREGDRLDEHAASGPDLRGHPRG